MVGLEIPSMLCTDDSTFRVVGCLSGIGSSTLVRVGKSSGRACLIVAPKLYWKKKFQETTQMVKGEGMGSKPFYLAVPPLRDNYQGDAFVTGGLCLRLSDGFQVLISWLVFECQPKGGKKDIEFLCVVVGQLSLYLFVLHNLLVTHTHAHTHTGNNDLTAFSSFLCWTNVPFNKQWGSHSILGYCTCSRSNS